MPNVIPIMAEVPVARPSIPSVRLAPLDTAVMMKITMGMNMIQAQSRYSGPIHLRRMA